MTTIAGDRIVTPDAMTVDHILQTIRKRESRGNYTALNATASASGAYQYVDGTWRTKSKNVAGATSYPRAYQAPPSIQDAVAAADVRAILSSTGNHLAAVPVIWYYPISWPPREGTDKGGIDYKPPGNPQTVRQYAEGWLKDYDGLTGSVPGIDASQLPPGVARDVLTGDAGWTIPNPMDAVTSVVDAIKVVWATLSSANTWMRVIKILGGVLAIAMGLMVLIKGQLPSGVPTPLDVVT